MLTMFASEALEVLANATSHVNVTAIQVAFDALPLQGTGLVALLVAFTPLISVLVPLAFGTLVALILRAQVPPLVTPYLSELSAYHGALLPAIGFGLLYVLPDVLNALYAASRRYGNAVVRVGSALIADAATVVRLTVFLAVVLALTMDVPFVRGVHCLKYVVALFLLSLRCVQGIVLVLQAIGKAASDAWTSPSIRRFCSYLAAAVLIHALFTMVALVQYYAMIDSAPLCLVHTILTWNAVATVIRVFLKVTQTSEITANAASVATADVEAAASFGTAATRARRSKRKARRSNRQAVTTTSSQAEVPCATPAATPSAATRPYRWTRTAVTAGFTFLRAVFVSSAEAMARAANYTSRKTRTGVTACATFIGAVFVSSAEAIARAANYTNRKTRDAARACSAFVGAVVFSSAEAIARAANFSSRKTRNAVTTCATACHGAFHACKNAVRFVCNSDAVRSAVLKIVLVAGIGGVSFCVGMPLGHMTSILFYAAQASNFIGVSTTIPTDDPHAALTCFHWLWTVALCIEFWTLEFTGTTLTQHLFRGMAALGRSIAAWCRHLWITGEDEVDAVCLAAVVSLVIPCTLCFHTCRAQDFIFVSVLEFFIVLTPLLGWYIMCWILLTEFEWQKYRGVSFVGTCLPNAATSVVALVNRAAAVFNAHQVEPAFPREDPEDPILNMEIVWQTDEHEISFIGTCLRNAVDRIATIWYDVEFYFSGIECAEPALPRKDPEEEFLVKYAEVERFYDPDEEEVWGWMDASKFRLNWIDFEKGTVDFAEEPVQTWKIMFIERPGCEMEYYDFSGTEYDDTALPPKDPEDPNEEHALVIYREEPNKKT